MTCPGKNGRLITLAEKSSNEADDIEKEEM